MIKRHGDGETTIQKDKEKKIDNAKRQRKRET